ncbi:MAG: PAS domain S-box protein [Acidobacteriota bacterium]|nr:PAS domain S-box protein [Acidobacteriota bacterium]
MSDRTKSFPSLNNGLPAIVGLRVQAIGLMADQVRAFDWSGTPLGAVENWPAALVVSVNNVLSAPFPSALFCGPELRMIYNDAYSELLGGKHPAALGEAVPVVWADAWPAIQPDVLKVMRGDGSAVRKDVLIPVNRWGTLCDAYWNYYLSPVLGADGSVGAVLVTCQEVTPAVLSAREARASEARILRSIGDAVIVTDAEGRVTRLNPIAEFLTGWLQAEAEGVSLQEIFRIINQSSREEVESPAERVRQLGVIVGLANHTILIRRDGTEVHIDDSAGPIIDGKGSLVGVVLVFRDVSERYRAQEALEESERDLTRFVDMIPTLAWIADADGAITWYNRRWYEYSGTSPSEMEGWGWQSLHKPEVLPAVMERWTQSIRTGEPFEMVFPLRRHDGVYRSFMTRVSPVRDPEGRITRWFGINTEIDELEQVRSALSAERHRLAAILDHVPIGLVFADAAGRITGGNPQVERLLRHPILYSASAEQYSEWVSYHADGRQVEANEYPLAKTLRDSGIHSGEYLYRRGDETQAWVQFTSAPITNDAGQMTGAVVATLDVDDRKRAEQALLRTEKLAAVGRLAASIAHEINNPLESVTNILYILRDLTEGETLRYVETAETELSRVSAITSQSLRFHKQSTKAVPCSCEALIADALSLFHPKLVNARVTVEQRHRAMDPVTCFDGEIRQVLNNLIGNAIDAMSPNGGRLLLRSRMGTHWRTGCRGAFLTIADTGAGMSPGVAHHVFEAFYTTKGMEGTGLGLWVSKEIIDRHQGTLHLRSSRCDGHSGTVFSVFLPFGTP